MCANEVVVEVTAPDNSQRAIIFVRDCGATTKFSTQISIVPSGRSLPNKAGNVFVAETGLEPNNVGADGRHAVSVSWLSSSALLVSHIGGIRVFRNATQVSGVTISY